MDTATIFLLSVLTLHPNGWVEAATHDTQYPSDASCMSAALKLASELGPAQLPRCDFWEPGTPTLQEIDAAGE